MKRKLFKSLMAVTLCTVMLGSTAFAADGPGVLDEKTDSDTNFIEGDATVINPIYNIVIPTKLEFAIDPFEQKGQSGIYSEDFSMINKSNVPVRLDLAVAITPKSDVSLTTTDAVPETDDSKKLYIAAEIPSAVQETTAAPGAYPTALVADGTDVFEAGDGKAPSSATTAVEDYEDTTAVKGTYTSNVKVTLGTTATTLTFALDGATYKNYFTADDKSASAKQFQKVAANEAGSATFRFTGKVNSKANWQANDVHAKVTYTFIGLSSANYTALIGKQVTNSHGYVVEATAPRFTGTGVTAANAGSAWDFEATFTQGSELTLTFDPGDSSATVSSVTWGTTVSEAKTSGLVTSTSTSVKVDGGMWVSAAANDVRYLQVTLSDSSTIVIKLTIAAAANP